MSAFLDTPLADLIPVNYERKMTPMDYVCAARVPQRLKPQTFGPWRIERIDQSYYTRAHASFGQQVQLCIAFSRVGFHDYTLLRRFSWATMHVGDGMEIVMEDSRHELQKHLPIWLSARGSVLVTGLGLGCVVRGLLAKKEVEHITVLEIDKSIMRVIGHEFEGNKRVEMVQADALRWSPGRRKFDFAWHDLWTDGEENLQVLHMKLLARYRAVCAVQGAWEFPRFMKRKVRRLLSLIG